MAKTTYTTKKRPVEQYEHKDKQRANNPPVGLVDAESAAANALEKLPNLCLAWAGKAERTSFEIPTVSLHVHERIRFRPNSAGTAARVFNSWITGELRTLK